MEILKAEIEVRKKKVPNGGRQREGRGGRRKIRRLRKRGWGGNWGGVGRIMGRTRRKCEELRREIRKGKVK